MRTDPSPACIRDLALRLGLYGFENDTDLQCAVWKALYERASDHVDQLQAAFARLTTLDRDNPDGAAQEAADMALFMEPFLTNRPFDLIAQLQARPMPTQPTYDAVG